MSRLSRVSLSCLAIAVVIVSICTIMIPAGRPADADRVVGSVPHLRKHTSVLWVGDSFTAGTGASDTQQSYVSQVSSHFGWAWSADAQGGTGFVNNGHDNFRSFVPLPERLAEDQRAHPRLDLVVIDAGRDDGGFETATVEPVAASYFDAVSAAWPSARVLVIAPYYLGNTSSAFEAFRTFERVEAQRRGWYFVDPIAQGWISPHEPGGLLYKDQIHPGPRGQDYISENLERAITASGVLKQLATTGPSTLVS